MAESERVGGGIALNIPVKEDEQAVSSPKAIPRRLRRRLLGPKSHVSAEEIEARLKEADLRRQQYYESLSCKARPKVKSPSRSSTFMEDREKRLEAKLIAAEQKRLSIIENAQKRLAKLHELRQAAKVGLELRFEKERDELGRKVESRVQKATRNRTLIFKAIAQRREARSQRAAQRLVQKKLQQSKYKECVRAAIHQKRAAAEKKRLGIMEDRLQRANDLRDQYLTERRGLHSYARVRSKPGPEHGEQGPEHGEHLSRMLARCWRRFVEVNKTTRYLTRTYCAFNINEKHIETMSFEQLAIQINSATVIQTTKALLDRLQTRLFLSHVTMGSPPVVKNINYLLKRLVTPVKKGHKAVNMSKAGEDSVKSKERSRQKLVKLVRYPARIFLCAYIIRRHPDAVFRVRGEQEILLAEAATILIQEFEQLMSFVLDGSISTPEGNRTSEIPSQKGFRSQLAAFDIAWCSYLHCFVAWKAKDAKLLERDLMKTYHEVEGYGVQKRKHPLESGERVFARDMKASQKEVTEDHRLVRDHKASSPVTQSHNPELGRLEKPSVTSNPESDQKLSKTDSGHNPTTLTTSKEHQSLDEVLASDNEIIVNEIVHGNCSTFADSFQARNDDAGALQAKVRETMEKAFWDGVMESMKQAEPDFSWVLKLMTEVRDELSEISPKDWRQDISHTIDTEILSQVLKSGNLDMDYLGNMLEYALITLQKLSAPAREEEIRTTHHELLKELREIAQAGGQPNASYAVLMVKGLRFVLQQIQVLKKEISKARLKMLEPLLKGPAGLEYLKKAFLNRFGPPDQASASLPLTKQWVTSLRSEGESEWNEYIDSLSTLPVSNLGSSHSQGPLPTSLRTGGSFSAHSNLKPTSSNFSGIELPECRGETVDLLVRTGLLKLVNRVGGLTLQDLPETLRLNLSRLRHIQSQIQKIVLISISSLILQQTLASENVASSPADMENVISKCIQQLSELLDRAEDAGLPEIMETISQLLGNTGHESNLEKHQAKKNVMANMIVKSLQAGDPIFTRVSRTVYLATKAAVLSGNTVKRKQLVDVALRRVGAARLSDKVMAVADVLILVAVVSCSVHGPWYEEILKT